jgi:hypothetical protein
MTENVCESFIKNKFYEHIMMIFDPILTDANPILKNFQQYTNECMDKNVIEKVYYLGHINSFGSKINNCYVSFNSLLFVSCTDPKIEYVNGKPIIYCYEILVAIGKYIGYFESFIDSQTNNITKYNYMPVSGIGVININYDAKHINETLAKSYDGDHHAFESDVFSKPDKYEYIINNYVGIDPIEYDFDRAFFDSEPSEFGFTKAHYLTKIMRPNVNYNEIKKESILHVEKKIISKNPTLKELNNCYHSYMSDNDKYH